MNRTRNQRVCYHQPCGLVGYPRRYALSLNQAVVALMEKQSQNNEHSPTERSWRPEAAEIVRQMIYHEGELINHRIGWLVTLQGLLFASLGFAWKDAKELVYVISALGILISISAFSALILWYRASKSILNEWRDHKPVDYNGPDVIGYRSQSKFWGFLRPWYFLPIIFAVAWLSVIVINLRRA
jgi:hypothetical protein